MSKGKKISNYFAFKSHSNASTCMPNYDPKNQVANGPGRELIKS